MESIKLGYGLLDTDIKTWLNELTPETIAEIFTVAHDSMKLQALQDVTYQTVEQAKIEQAKIADHTQEYAYTAGKRGEDLFESLCKNLPIDFTLQNTSKIGKQGDFILEYRYQNKLYRSLVDIKNYKSTVPKKELDKFYEDLSYGNYDSGLIISYNSQFTGVLHSIHVENKQLPNGLLPVMYLSMVPNDLIIKCIEVLFLKTIVCIQRQVDSSAVDNVISYINMALSQSGITRRILSELQTSIGSQINRCLETLISMEVQIKQSIRELEKSTRNVLSQVSQPTQPTQLINQPAGQLINQPASQPANQPAGQLINQPASQPASRLISQLTTKPLALHEFAHRQLYSTTSLNNDLLQTIYVLPWDKITENQTTMVEDGGFVMQFISTSLSITVMPLTNIVKVMLCHATDMSKFPLFKKNKGKYIANLSSELVIQIETHFTT